ALTELAGLAGTSVETLALLTGRGQRSGVGIHGFREGGLIVDAGRRESRSVPTRLLQLPFPEEWSILIIIPERATGLFGSEEAHAFDTLSPLPDASSDRLCRLV